MFSSRVSHKSLNPRLDAEHYEPTWLEREAAVHRLGLKVSEMDSLRVPDASITYGIVQPGDFQKPGSGIRIIRCTDIEDLSIHTGQVLWVSAEIEAPYKRSRVQPGDVLVGIAGTLGVVGVAPDGIGPANLNQSVARIRCETRDSGNWLACFLATKFGSAILDRRAVGGVQRHLNLEDLPGLPVLQPAPEAQAYIGNKVRQAEALRARARAVQSELDATVSQLIPDKWSNGVEQHGRTGIADLGHRLDPKYYGEAAKAIRSATAGQSVSIAALEPTVSNGFESREFVDSGRPYITVSEVSSGHLRIDDAPHIPLSVNVPSKAQLNERCALVVRTGSIGTAVQPLPEDCHAAISSHLIRLEFETPARAAAVCAFLSSAPGRILQKAASYGAVQPQISQDDLLEIALPVGLLQAGEKIHSSQCLIEEGERIAIRLVQSARLLVEALIERKITERDLIAAHEDPAADRALLTRLTAAGLDAPDADPLFPDLDRLAELLSETGTPQ